jgi:ATP-dependent Clp protease ATP-binding subunit ClpC
VRDIAAESVSHLTPRACRVLDIARRQGERFGHSHIGTEHLLLALVLEGDGVAAQVLREVGASERIRERLETFLDSDTYKSSM